VRTTSIRTERDEVLFARRDLNHDGRITRDEWGDRSAFNRLDKNHDNVISAYEYGVGR
jgi:Ca2+-binding EF-hand superfamily protein